MRIFRTPSPGVLRLDHDVAISEAVYEGIVLRHYAFAGHWFKINVTTSLSGGLSAVTAHLMIMRWICEVPSKISTCPPPRATVSKTSRFRLPHVVAASDLRKLNQSGRPLTVGVQR